MARTGWASACQTGSGMYLFSILFFSFTLFYRCSHDANDEYLFRSKLQGLDGQVLVELGVAWKKVCLLIENDVWSSVCENDILIGCLTCEFL